MAQLADTALISDANLIGYYKFDSGALTTDSSGDGNTLTNNNTVGELGSGKYGVSADFGSANTDKYFSLAHDYGTNGQTVTIAFWFKMTNASDSVGFFILADTDIDVQLHGKYDGTTLGVYRFKVGGVTESATYTVAMDTNWHHYAVTLSNGGSGGPMLLYLDGVEVASTTVTTGSGVVNSSNEFFIGRGDSPYMKGYMDDVAVFNKVLTLSEVVELAEDGSASASSSASRSASRSLSPSASLSPSSSVSRSASSSVSRSLSPSSSRSASVSASPSLGYTGYTRYHEATLPTTDNDLTTVYSAQNVTDVATSDDVRVDQTATGEYMIHQFKNFVGTNTVARLKWEGQTNLAPSTSTVYLQIFNRNSSTWETVSSDGSSSANADFTMIADISSLTNYKDGGNVISSRVYQLAI